MIVKNSSWKVIFSNQSLRIFLWKLTQKRMLTGSLHIICKWDWHSYLHTVTFSFLVHPRCIKKSPYIIGLLVYRTLSVAFAGESGPVRYDKLCPGEVRDLLLCFLHTLKHIPESHLLSWWLTLSHQTLTSFFTLLQ